jgi:tetratricopeptide (TPR) repeat protein
MIDSTDQLILQLETAPEKDKLAIFARLADIFDPITEARRYEILGVQVATRTTNIVPFCLSILANHDAGTELRVFAAVVGASACRRNRRRSEGQAILRQVKDLEQNYPILLHLYAITFRGGEPAELRRGLREAEQAYARLRPNSGAAHDLAAFLTDLAYLEDDEEIASNNLQRALVLVNEAIQEEPRGRFYYTRGRINRKLGNLEAAKSDLEVAIETEDSSAIDYRHRITEYILESSLVDADRATQHFQRRAAAAIDQSEERNIRLETRVDEASEKFAGTQLQIISTLAFFASILALIQFAALTLGKGYNLTQALILVGALGFILFSAIVVGSLMLRRGMKVQENSPNRHKGHGG